MKEGPMKEHIERGDDGVVKSLYITYRKKDGMLVKETTVRQFYDDNVLSSKVIEIATEKLLPSIEIYRQL